MKASFIQDGFDPARIEYSYNAIRKEMEAWKKLGKRIVVTIGSWDMLHIGHVRYIIEASKYGDKLIVGVDSDSAVRSYKGPGRPIIPQTERIEMISYIWCVDLVTLITDVNDKGRWQYGLIKAVRPDVFIAVEDSYPESQRRQIRKYVGNLIVLPRQAERTSSTDIVQRVIKTELIGKVDKAKGG
jgi:D-beta-D-heptose 7-phosphate kinase/D-beta-D-heptose 1-phosphate adenosyltransferase